MQQKHSSSNNATPAIVPTTMPAIAPPLSEPLVDATGAGAAVLVVVSLAAVPVVVVGAEVCTIVLPLVTL